MTLRCHGPLVGYGRTSLDILPQKRPLLAMTQYEAVVEYAGKRVKVKSDSFEELHTALAGIEELNQDADFLKDEKSVEDVVPVHRRDGDDHEYFGLQDRRSRKNVTYGKKRGESVIPFFPKGADGYYEPGATGPRNGGSRSRREQRQGPQQPRRHDEERAQERSAERRPARRRQAEQAGASDDLPF